MHLGTREYSCIAPNSLNQEPYRAVEYRIRPFKGGSSWTLMQDQNHILVEKKQREKVSKHFINLLIVAFNLRKVRMDMTRNRGRKGSRKRGKEDEEKGGKRELKGKEEKRGQEEKGKEGEKKKKEKDGSCSGGWWWIVMDGMWKKKEGNYLFLFIFLVI